MESLVAEELLDEVPVDEAAEVDVRPVSTLRVGEALAVERLLERLDVTADPDDVPALGVVGVLEDDGRTPPHGAEAPVAVADEALVDLQQVGVVVDVDAARLDLDLLGQLVHPLRGAVEDQLDEPALRGPSEPRPVGDGEGGVGAQRTAVGGVGQQDPVLLGRRAHEGRVLTELDLVGLLGEVPGGVAAALDLEGVGDAVEGEGAGDVVVPVEDGGAAVGGDDELGGDAGHPRALRRGGLAGASARGCEADGEHAGQPRSGDGPECLRHGRSPRSRPWPGVRAIRWSGPLEDHHRPAPPSRPANRAPTRGGSTPVPGSTPSAARGRDDAVLPVEHGPVAVPLVVRRGEGATRSARSAARPSSSRRPAAAKVGP